MGPLLKVSDEDKKKGIRKPEIKIKGFYKGCLSLGNEYKYDQEVIDWSQGYIDDGMTKSEAKSNSQTGSTLIILVNNLCCYLNIAAVTGIKSLREDGDNLEAMLREFLLIGEEKRLLPSKNSPGVKGDHTLLYFLSFNVQITNPKLFYTLPIAEMGGEHVGALLPPRSRVGRNV
ncbi:hypothetical protein Tco_0052148 [Tanacetum coccineum]